MRTPENVFSPTRTRNRSDLASVKADRYIEFFFLLSIAGVFDFYYFAAQAETCRITRKAKINKNNQGNFE